MTKWYVRFMLQSPALSHSFMGERHYADADTLPEAITKCAAHVDADLRIVGIAQAYEVVE